MRVGTERLRRAGGGRAELISDQDDMSEHFGSLEEALLALSNTDSPDWVRAFNYLAAHPETARAMADTFRETLEQMGVEAGGVDPQTGEPVYALADVARALGVPQADLDAAVAEAETERRRSS
jgi:hypothetical protein